MLGAAVCVALVCVAACGADPSAKSADWPSWGDNPKNTHASPLTAVGPANVSRLRVVWTRSEGVGQSEWETFPIVVGTTMYYNTDTDVVVARDAATGKLRWAYAPDVDFFASGPAGTVAPSAGGSPSAAAACTR